MKYLLLFLLSFSAMGKEHIVLMKRMKFVPKTVEIELGDTIKFINKDRAKHNVMVKKLKIKTKLIKKDQVIVIKPDKKGKFKYYCQPHRTMMKGLIKVR